MMIRTLSEKGLTLLKKLEGFSSSTYQDSGGVWTLGYGHTKGVSEGDICTSLRAEQWLQEDLQWAIETVNTKVHVILTQPQFDALVIFTYNVGLAGFSGSSVLASLNSGAGMEVVIPNFFHFISAGKKVMSGLINRRAAEAVLFSSKE